MSVRITKLDWPQVTLASVAIVTLAAVYLMSDISDKHMIQKAVLGVWAFVSTFLGPAIRRQWVPRDPPSEGPAEAPKEDTERTVHDDSA